MKATGDQKEEKFVTCLLKCRLLLSPSQKICSSWNSPTFPGISLLTFQARLLISVDINFIMMMVCSAELFLAI